MKKRFKEVLQLKADEGQRRKMIMDYCLRSSSSEYETLKPLQYVGSLQYVGYHEGILATKTYNYLSTEFHGDYVGAIQNIVPSFNL